jgi:hypothetical protein
VWLDHPAVVTTTLDINYLSCLTDQIIPCEYPLLEVSHDPVDRAYVSLDAVAAHLLEILLNILIEGGVLKGRSDLS